MGQPVRVLVVDPVRNYQREIEAGETAVDGDGNNLLFPGYGPPVDDIPALKAVPASRRVDQQVRLVEDADPNTAGVDYPSNYAWDSTSTESPDPGSPGRPPPIVLPDDAPAVGRWVRAYAEVEAGIDEILANSNDAMSQSIVGLCGIYFATGCEGGSSSSSSSGETDAWIVPDHDTLVYHAEGGHVFESPITFSDTITVWPVGAVGGAHKMTFFFTESAKQPTWAGVDGGNSFFFKPGDGQVRIEATDPTDDTAILSLRADKAFEIANLTFFDLGSNHNWTFHMLGTDHATDGDDLYLDVRLVSTKTWLYFDTSASTLTISPFEVTVGTWSTTALTMAKPIYLGANGIGRDDSVLTFAAGATGTATFAGDANARGGVFAVGVNDTQVGLLLLYGHAAATDPGGAIFLYTSADHDTSIDSYRMRANQDDLEFLAVSTVKLTLQGSDGTWLFGAAVGMGTNAITGLSDPSDPQDAATKAYVDAQIVLVNDLHEVLANGNDALGQDILNVGRLSFIWGGGSLSSSSSPGGDDGVTYIEAQGDIIIYHGDGGHKFESPVWLTGPIYVESGVTPEKYMKMMHSDVDDDFHFHLEGANDEFEYWWEGAQRHRLTKVGFSINGNFELPTTTSTVGSILQTGGRILHTYGTDNVFVGRQAGNFTLTGTGGNTAIGDTAGDSLTNGNSNTMLGSKAGTALTGGNYNTFIGFASGLNATGSNDCVFLGYRSGYYETGNNKLFIDNIQRADEADGRVKALIYGVFASTTAGQSVVLNANVTIRETLDLVATTSTAGQITQGGTRFFHTYGSANLFLGKNAGNFTLSGDANLVVGENAGTALTSGSENVFVGINAGIVCTIGIENLCVGFEAGRVLTEGAYNTLLGKWSGYALDTGNLNVIVGHAAGTAVTSGERNTIVGVTAGAAITTADDSVYLGFKAGFYETVSNKLYIDNTQRSSEADGRVKALIYGIFAATTAAQYVTINGNLIVRESLDLLSGAVLSVASTQVVGARVIDARADDVANSGDSITDGLIDALRDAMITHGLIAAA